MTRAEERYDAYLDELFERRIDELIALADDGVTNYKAVSPHAKEKLKGLLKYYAKKKHPWRACVADNTKRFGLERAQRVCSVLKDLEYGTTKWRDPKYKGGPQPQYLAEPMPDFDDEVADFLIVLDESPGLYDFLCLDEYEDDDSIDEIHLAALTSRKRDKFPDASFALPKQRKYPIHDERHAMNALARVAQHGTDEEKAKVRAAVKRRFPHLNVNMMRRKSDRKK